jgi:hypothetical protein
MAIDDLEGLAIVLSLVRPDALRRCEEGYLHLWRVQFCRVEGVDLVAQRYFYTSCT